MNTPDIRESGTWNGIGGMLMTLSASLLPASDFTAFGLGHHEWAIIAAVAAFACFGLGVFLKGSVTPPPPDERRDPQR